ncbi:MAG: hypothetical protein IPK30_03130 [Cellvibrionales bacterium]|nr:hypothetical protein [Cellvibrionales bacterium]
MVPVDVLLRKTHRHSAERKLHSGFNAHFVKALEPEAQKLVMKCWMNRLPQGECELVQQFAWRFADALLIIRLLGLPESDYEQIKA